MTGIGITVFNRNETFYKTLEKLKEHQPPNSKIVIVDDGSAIPIVGSTFRFEENQGAPIAKNKCLELLDGCDEIFLFDDDLEVLKDGWEIPYIESKEPHLNFTFAYNSFEKYGHKVCDNPNGCMIYFNRSAIDKVGGFDTQFEKYGYWHGSMSCRIYNAGLTSFPFMDVIGSEKLFKSLDEKKEVKSATKNKSKYLRKNKQRYFEQIGSSDYKPYKKVSDNFKVWYSTPFSTEKNIGKALNEFCENIPDKDWICLMDGDSMFLTPEWGLQIKETIKRHGNEFDLIGCVTNRLGRKIQLVDGMDYDNFDVKYHYGKAVELRDNNWCEVEDITSKRYVAGLLMLFPKTLWNKIKFKENCSYFDDVFSKEVLKNKGKLGLMKGLYKFHFYRGWSDNPKSSKDHLK